MQYNQGTSIKNSGGTFILVFSVNRLGKQCIAISICKIPYSLVEIGSIHPALRTHAGIE